MTAGRRTKILATLGPASSSPTTIAALIASGADLLRINMSHTEPADVRRLVDRVRAAEREAGRPIGLLADLQGPKLRIGRFAAGSAVLAAGDRFDLDASDEPGDERRVQLPHDALLAAVHHGAEILLDDGRIRLKCVASSRERIETVVTEGGVLADRKGVSVPGVEIPLAALTEKDRRDLDIALAEGVDWIALSFVQRASDVAEVRKIARGRAGVMAKIEKPQAVHRLEDILEISDALMVARGDLGVESPLETVPGLQKRIVRACRRAGKPVVVATQMLESMVAAPIPTRAEVSDVATAVFEGTDAVMLSAETATGDFPVEAVATMDKVAREVERDINYPSILKAQRVEPEATGADAIAAAARQITETLGLPAIVCYTVSGSTALRVARERPSATVVAISPVVGTARRLTLAWGVRPVVGPDATDPDDMVDRATRISQKIAAAAGGDRVIVLAGVPFGTPGATNLLRLATVPVARSNR